MDNINTIYEEFDKHLVNDNKPSEYFNSIRSEEWFRNDYPFTLLAALMKTEQSKQHHPEGDVWNHTMMVVDNAAERRQMSSNPRNFMWAALLHDLGKAPTTKIKNGKITSYDHDKVGEHLAVEFLKVFTTDREFISDVSKLVRWHMQILFVNKNLPFVDIGKMARETSIDEIALLGLCDRLGRGEMTHEKIDEEKRNIDIFKEKCEEFLEKHMQKIPD